VAACAAATEWASWLYPRPFVDVAVLPVAGVALAALLLLEPRDWHGALVGVAAVVVVVQLLNGMGVASSLVLGLAAEGEAVALAGAVVGVTILAFRLWADPLAYAAVLLLVWAALRFGVRGVAGAALAMVAIADWATARGTGPFAGAASSSDDRTLLLQVFVAGRSLAVMRLAVALEGRDLAAGRRGGRGAGPRLPWAAA